ncbi:hypothetical protein Tco_0841921 [Tanacetum coccineum]|uniref:Xylulose kinase-1 n=1 Tax=Tanacetum coccineum TaxID=301880 RepID=A0ABQ5AZL4_9ASTR
MSALKFADSHNMVAFLAKPTESEGFEQIVDFLNANPIKYALTVNPTIYTSCIEQFWATAKVKTVNGEVQLQALVDGKKVIITETSVRRDLQLEDAEGIESFFSPQWKFFIHTILECLSAKSTAWNEFSSTMASAIICLATNQKFNFSKYIFESMVKNVDSSVKFLMYPRFVQVFLVKQVGDMSTHDEIFVTPSHTKKVFGNMKRVGKGFSRAVTPLFPTMMVQAQQEQGEGLANPTDPQHTPTIAQPSSSQPQKKHKLRKPKKKDTRIPQSSVPSDNIAEEAINEENVPTHSNDPLLSGEDRLKLKELMTLCTNLQNRVLDLEHTKTTQALEIDSLKRRVKKLEKKQRSRTHGLRRLYKGRKIHDIDADEDITLENVHDEDMFGVNDLEGDEIVFESEVADKDVNLSVHEVTLAQALTALKTVSPRLIAKGIAFHEQEQAPTPIVTSQQPTQLDEELALKLQAEKDEEERLAREKDQKVEEANIVWDDIQAKVKADYQLAQRLQAQEQEELSDIDKAILFVQLLEKRRKFFAAKRAKEKRNNPPTKA